MLSKQPWSKPPALVFPKYNQQTLKSSASTATKATQAPYQGPTEDCEENPFYVPTSTVVENDQLRSVKKRRTDRPLNVTFAPSPPSSPRRIRFAEVTQIKRNTSDILSRPTHCASTPANHKLYEYGRKPPSVQGLVATADDHGIPNKVYQEVYYSKEVDAPDRAKEYAGILFRIRGGTGLSALEEWDGEDKTPIPGPPQRKKGPLGLPRIIGIDGWEYNRCPPSRRGVRSWLIENPIPTETARRKAMWASQVNRQCLYRCCTAHDSPDRRTYPNLVKQWAGANPREKGKSVHAGATIYVYIITGSFWYAGFCHKPQMFSLTGSRPKLLFGTAGSQIRMWTKSLPSSMPIKNQATTTIPEIFINPGSSLYTTNVQIQSDYGIIQSKPSIPNWNC